MGDVIFSTSLFWLLLYSPIVVLAIIMFVAYFMTGGYGLKLKNSRRNTPNIFNGFVQLILSLVLAISVFLTYSGGEQNLKMRLEDKSIYRGKFTNYYVYSSTDDQYNVSSDAYYQMEVGSCYMFTFYKARGVLTIFYRTDLVTSIAQEVC